MSEEGESANDLNIRHLQALKHNSLVRQIATDLIENRANDGALAPLLAAISDISDEAWRERIVAAWALGHLPLTPTQQEIVAQRLEKILDGRSYATTLKFDRAFQFFKRSLWFTVPQVVCLPFAARVGDTFEACVFITVVCMFLIPIETAILAPFLAPLSFALDRRRADKARISAAATLGKLHLPSSVGVLAYGAYGSGANVRLASLRALRKILPTLQETHYGSLSTDAVPNLCRLLSNPEESFVLELLEALGKVGDGRAVKPVAFLAANTHSSAVKEAVERILPVLQERLRQEQAPQVLLRASSETVMPDTLLRAATSSIESAQPQQLLRASAQKISSLD